MSFLDDSTYAVVRKDCGKYGYGHLNVRINNLLDTFGVRPYYYITAQCGSTRDVSLTCDREFYAMRAGFTCDEQMNAYWLDKCAKFAKKIEAKVAKMDFELTQPKTYAEFVARHLIASGVRYVVFIAADDGSYTGRLEEQYVLDLKADRANIGFLRENLARFEEHVLTKMCGEREAA